METTKFKTNIMCAGCIAKVTPVLNEALGEGNWQVDIKDPSKILSVTDGKAVEKAAPALEKIGYKVERL
jgi:copper chaperone CopZ